MTDDINKLFTISSYEPISKSPSMLCVKRLQSDLSIVKHEPMENVDIYVDEENLLVWYFLVCNLDDPYKYGYYIGRVIVDPDYPMKPPLSYKFFTPSGRFSIGEKICVSNSSYHSESWSPLWNMKTVILGLVSIFLDVKEYGIGHIGTPTETKRMLAIQSFEYNRKHYLPLIKKFDRFINEDGTPKTPVPLDLTILSDLDSVIEKQDIVNDDIDNFIENKI